MKLVVAGDVVAEINDAEHKKLGPGLLATVRDDKSVILTLKSGVLYEQKDKVDRIWLETSQKRYYPSVHDPVVGIITSKLSDHYKVDIGASYYATLSFMAFEGATKKNRPTLNVGSLVYARVVVAHRDFETELACMSVNERADGFGPLENGYMFQCSTGMALSLLKPDSHVLKVVGKIFSYEIAVGVNGRVWINSKSIPHTIALSNLIMRSEYLTESELDEEINLMSK